MISLSEATIQANARLAVGRLPFTRLFRNNRGKAWMGKTIHGAGQTVVLQKGDVLIRGGRPVEFGLTDGASDLIGPTQIVVTPSMIGQKLALFTAGECKKVGETVPEHQQRFLDFVRGFGGLSGVIRCNEDALRLVTEHNPT